MTIREVAEYMSQMKDVVSSLTMRKVREILALATEYSYLGAKFTFNASENLDYEVNRLLLALSDAIYEETLSRAKMVLENDKDEGYVIPLLPADTQERLDQHSSNLKVLLEGYLALCFANKATNSDIIGDVMTYLSNPLQYIKSSFKNADTYNAEIIRTRGFHFGAGMPTNPIIGFTNVSGYVIDDAFDIGQIKSFMDEGAIGYEIYRGSGYLCPLCDDVCFDGSGKRIVYGFNDAMPIPQHPHCMCFPVAVYADE